MNTTPECVSNASEDAPVAARIKEDPGGTESSRARRGLELTADRLSTAAAQRQRYLIPQHDLAAISTCRTIAAFTVAHTAKR